jgi:SAM-dependent methyltransferase/glycosyltransferase involved in cell wall biosynthesis
MMVEVVALIATADRPNLLEARALPSILAQRQLPDRVVVVNDSRTPASHSLSEAVARRVSSAGIAVQLLRNRRTRGAPGAWNSGLDHILRHSAKPSQVFVAFLDDDDEWLSDHVARCRSIIASRNPDVLAAQFCRIDHRTHKPTPPPERLQSADFLTGNPGIQASSLVCRLTTLLEAGMFDEALPSCTDRDLMVRIADLGHVDFRACEHVGSIHHASPTLPRLSTPRSPAKQKGLDAFWSKYQSRMSAEQRDAHCERARKFFEWVPPQQATPGEVRSDSPAGIESAEDPIHLVVGFVADAEQPGNSLRLLDDLKRLRGENGLCGLDVLVLENSDSLCPSSDIAEVVQRARSEGLRLHLVDRATHIRAENLGQTGSFGAAAGRRLSITESRTVLQSYLYAFARIRPGSVVWILDDDMRLTPMVDDGEHVSRSYRPVVPSIQRARASGADIAIGHYTGAAPLPFAATLRVQLVDLVASLQTLAALQPDDAPPSVATVHRSLRAGRRDYYYDLSRAETDRLEQPFLFEAPDGATARQCLALLAELAPRILAGEQVFRPLIFDETRAFAADSQSPPQRGGNTIVFDVEALRDVPNLSPRVEGRSTRRSDSIWTTIQAVRFGRRICHIALPLFQDRTLSRVQRIDVERVVDDIRGYAVATAMAEPGTWSPDRLTERTQKYLDERVAAFRLSFYRVRGLVRALRRILQEGWLGSEALQGPRRQLLAFAELVDESYSLERLHEIIEQAQLLEPRTISTFLDGIDGELSSHAARLESATELLDGIALQRLENARIAATRLAGVRPDARLLGAGAEGVVLTDERRVYKVFDYWKARHSLDAREFIRGLVGRWPDAKALHPILDFIEDGSDAVLTYDYSPNEPYRGGQGPALVDLLIECHQNGIACRNVHPDNLRVEAGRVRLIDFGSDTVPLSEEEFEMMCRRAFLTWRWWHRPDLKPLMTRSLNSTDGPFMTEYPSFRQAVALTLGTKLTPDPTWQLVQEASPRRVLDYGCGKAKDSACLADAGAEVVVFDPDSSLAPRLERHASPTFRITDSAGHAVAKGPFDVVVCRRVICTIADDDDAAQVLRNLRDAVSNAGRVVVSVCHPAEVGMRETPECRATAAANATPDSRLVFSKAMRASGRERIEVRRPEWQLRRMFAAANLRVVRREECFTVDLERFEPTAELLVFELVPMKQLDPVSLVIKACAMDAHTLEQQVKHLVHQLEEPRAFAERILVLDSRRDGFLRAHDSGDLARARATADRLLEQGLIDRVLEGPESGTSSCRVNERWFGLPTRAPHATTGAQVASTLAAFDACRSRYVLQVDVDSMVVRREQGHDYLVDMMGALTNDPRAVTVSFNTCHDEPRAYTSEGQEGPWRTEVRFSMLDRVRLEHLLPLPNELNAGQLSLPWHRSLDLAVQRGRATSLRGGDPRTYYIHPPNARKSDLKGWMRVLGRIEAGYVPPEQFGSVEWRGDDRIWFGPKRAEPFIFIISGRNVPPARFRRCWDSVLAQSRTDWGAIVVDDDSHRAWALELEHTCATRRQQTTLVRNAAREGLLANTVHALRDFCTNPESIIITLDADDMLTTSNVLDELSARYAAGADLTVGSMLRTDKAKDYPVNFDNPRAHRGGNVWQHLRTFRKRLFDQVTDTELQIDGEFVDLASDWALMLALVERAEHPVCIDKPLYLHEPSGVGKRHDRHKREAIIARIVERRSGATHEVTR